MDRGGTAELERVRGDLHHAGAVAGVEHPAERPLQVDRLRGGPLDRLRRPADDLLDRAEQAGADAGPLEDRADEKGGRRLPVRPGHADHAELGARIAEEPRRDRCHRRPRVGDDELRNGDVERALDDERHGAGLDDGGREVVAVGGAPGHAEEQRPGPDRAAVERNVGDLALGPLSGDPCLPVRQRVA